MFRIILPHKRKSERPNSVLRKEIHGYEKNDGGIEAYFCGHYGDRSDSSFMLWFRFVVYAGQPAEKEAGFVNISGDGGDDIVSLSASRVFRAYLPVDMTEEEAERTAETAEWSLVRNGESEYTDPDLYPNAWQGGSLDSLICMDGRNALFEEVATGAETKEGSVYLTLTFRNNLYFYSMDGGTGAPHSNGRRISGYLRIFSPARRG